MQSPKVTVVTVTYNNAEGLARTLPSVLAQSYPNLEYIVVDGGSTDASLALIQSHAGRIAHWVSEADGGVYDGMNKGVKLASGDWIIFMNAGDTFQNQDTVTEMFQAPADDADILYGGMLRFYEKEGVTRAVPGRPVSVLPLQMPCSHQSLFARRTLLERFPFSTDFSIVADHEFVLRAQLAGLRFRQVDRAIGVFATGGKSDQQRAGALDQLTRMLARHGVLTPGLRLQIWRMRMRALSGAWLRRHLPQALVRLLLKGKPVSW